MIELLLRLGADPTIADDKGTSPLELAERYELSDAVGVLKDAFRKHRP